MSDFRRLLLHILLSVHHPSKNIYTHQQQVLYVQITGGQVSIKNCDVSDLERYSTDQLNFWWLHKFMVHILTRQKYDL